STAPAGAPLRRTQSSVALLSHATLVHGPSRTRGDRGSAAQLITGVGIDEVNDGLIDVGWRPGATLLPPEPPPQQVSAPTRRLRTAVPITLPTDPPAHRCVGQSGQSPRRRTIPAVCPAVSGR